MNPLKIEVTEAMWEAAAEAMAMGGWDVLDYHVQSRFADMAGHALTAAFQHPEFVAQLNQWRPIESAPRDRRHILAWFPECLCTFSVVWHEGDWHFAGAGLVYHGKPTHWQPLPEPPRANLGRLLGEEA
jgi:hypothetical protein